MAPPALDPKQCTKCKQLKPRSAFGRIRKLPNAIRSRCRDCVNEYSKAQSRKNPELTAIRNRRSKIKRAFGISLDQYNKMLISQNGKCAICGSASPGGRGGVRGSFHIDHCHSTKTIRGLLCHMCNIGIGHFKENVIVMKDAIRYLENKGVAN